MKFSGKVSNGPVNKWWNFAGNLDHRFGYGYGSGSILRHW